MKPVKAISLNVKRIRASRDMSQTAAAKAAGISRQDSLILKTAKPRAGSAIFRRLPIPSAFRSWIVGGTTPT